MPPTTLHEVSRQWAHANFYADKAWREECDRYTADEAARIVRLEKKRPARRTTTPTAEQPAPTSGPGWRVRRDLNPRTKEPS